MSKQASEFVQHMQDAAATAVSYVDGLDRTAFLADRRTQQAVVLNLMVLGEANGITPSHTPPFAGQVWGSSG